MISCRTMGHSPASVLEKARVKDSTPVRSSSRRLATSEERFRSKHTTRKRVRKRSGLLATEGLRARANPPPEGEERGEKKREKGFRVHSSNAKRTTREH